MFTTRVGPRPAAAANEKRSLLVRSRKVEGALQRGELGLAHSFLLARTRTSPWVTTLIAGRRLPVLRPKVESMKAPSVFPRTSARTTIVSSRYSPLIRSP